MQDFQAVNQAVLQSWETTLREWLPSGKREGAEWVALNPTRADNKPGSFRINTRTGQWADFATNDKGGDPISLFAYLNGIGQGDAAKQLAARYGVAMNDNQQTPRHRLGKPSAQWRYLTAEGEHVGTVFRFDTPTGKEVVPYSLIDGRWQWKSLPKPRLLYGLPKVAADPTGAVLVVEGEKAADAAQALFPTLVVVTWPGGGKAVKYADFGPLAGKRVVLWPDADAPGYDAMREVAAILTKLGCKVRFCLPPADAEPGWDLADADPSIDWLHYLRENLVEDLPANDNAQKSAIPVADMAQKSENVDTSAGHVVPVSRTGSVDFYSPLPDANDKGRPLATIENLQEVCRRLNLTIRYNVISKEEEILIPDESFSVDNRANASLAWLSSWCARFRMPTDKLGDFVTYLADKQLYNPVAEWINSKPWDGKTRLPDLYATITSNDEPLKEILLRRWLVSAIAAAFEPDGVSAHGVLVLQGDQYLGKTKWFKQLVPQHLGVVQDGMMLRPDDRDSVKQVCSFWLVELGELDATFRKSDIAALKSFITRKNDVLRRAYARKESYYARRTVFFGSVNPKQFLHDSTGNRRYWTIEATGIDHSHNLDMQQVWAEVLELWKAGETYYLQPQEMARLNDHNEDFTVVEPIQERILTRLDWSADHISWEWKTATEVLISVGMDRPSSSDSTKAALFIRQRNGGNAKRTNGATRLFVPPIMGSSAF
jgi:hypothetical protein